MMDRRLSENEIQYLLDHLEPLYRGASLKPYLRTEEIPAGEAMLYFPLSDNGLEIDEVMSIDSVPVLFPCSGRQQWYSLKGKQVHFYHDILKSAFFLLSGFQEHGTRERDRYGRFPWKSSVQYRLGITQKPVVNYYFEIILEAFGKFCRLNQLEFEIKQGPAPLLFLSHDVDRIKKYTLRNLAIVALQLAGIKKTGAGLRARLQLFVDYAAGILLFRKNPYWTFQEMCDLEEELRISSTWFFLEKTRMDNSRYHFRQDRIRDLIATLLQKGHEVGIHGTLESSTDQQEMEGGVLRLRKACGCPVQGIRQHFLKYHMPLTAVLQEAAGLSYDASLGFAECPGFRNSYAYPFRLYDFDQGKARSIWQLPLNAMEASLLEYQDVPVDAFYASLEPLLEEVSRFRGVFSLLWHNCRLDEEENPGIKNSYRDLLEKIMGLGFLSARGQDAVQAFKSGGASGSSSSA